MTGKSHLKIVKIIFDMCFAQQKKYNNTGNYIVFTLVIIITN